MYEISFIPQTAGPLPFSETVSQFRRDAVFTYRQSTVKVGMLGYQADWYYGLGKTHVKQYETYLLKHPQKRHPQRASERITIPAPPNLILHPKSGLIRISEFTLK